MSDTTQALHASAEKWLPKNSQQRLYWVLFISCGLLLASQTWTWLRRAPDETAVPVAVVTAEAPEAAALISATAPADATAAPDSGDEVVVVNAVAVEDSSNRTMTAENEADTVPTNSAQANALDSAEPSADQNVVARVFAALGGAGQTKTTEPASQTVDAPAEVPEFFAALVRYAAQPQETRAAHQSRQRGIEYLFTLHAPPASQEVAEFFARQLAHDKHEASPREAAQTPVTSEPATVAVAASSEVPSEPTPNADAVAETGAGQTDSTATASKPAADLAAQAEAAATAEENRQELPSAELVLVNPAESGGTILYLVEGQAFSLAPGQSHRLPADRPWRVVFHRGDDFGDTEILLSTGQFNFAVGPQGWQLVPVDGR